MAIEERREQLKGATNPHEVLKANWLRKVKGKHIQQGVEWIKGRPEEIVEIVDSVVDRILEGGLDRESLVQLLHTEIIDPVTEPIIEHGWLGGEVELSETFNQTSEDVLTGLYHRRMFFVLVEKIILPRMRRLMRHDGTYAPFGHIVMLDIDKFKDINSMFGHKGGDHALAEFGSAIRHHFREDDVIGRIGGDEFVVIAPGIREEDINSRMEALRAHFQSEPMRMLRVDIPHEYGNAKLTFTFKVEMISDPDSLQTRIYAADADVMRHKALRDDQERRDRRK